MRRGGSWNVVLLAGVFLFVAVLCCSAYAQPGEERLLVSPAAVEMILKNAKALRDEAAALAEAGKESEAAALLKRADQMEGRAKEFVAGMLKRAEELRKKAADFATAGREDDAAALRQVADALERGARGLAVGKLPVKPVAPAAPLTAAEEMLKRAKELRKEAARLAEAGKQPEAAALRKEADELECRATELLVPKPPVAPRPELERIAKSLEELQRTVNELRVRIEKLEKELLKIK